MPNPVQALLYILSQATDRELARQVQYLQVENRILRNKLPKRITISRAERSRLLKFGQPVGAAIRQLIAIVLPSTFARWVRETQSPKHQKVSRIGRPKKPPALRKLILKIARETGWGYTRVLGEIRKLTSQKVSRQTVANIMREAGLDPGPKRGEKKWDEFLRIHAQTLWQADFFCKRAMTLKAFGICTCSHSLTWLRERYSSLKPRPTPMPSGSPNAQRISIPTCAMRSCPLNLFSTMRIASLGRHLTASSGDEGCGHVDYAPSHLT
jgi:hypothetical protein